MLGDTEKERHYVSYKWKEEHKSLYIDNLNNSHLSDQLHILKDNLTTDRDMNSIENNVNYTG